MVATARTPKREGILMTVKMVVPEKLNRMRELKM